MTSLFVCDKCNTVDTTVAAYPSGNFNLAAMKCTKCQTGVWHNYFPAIPYNPQKDNVCNRATGVGLG